MNDTPSEPGPAGRGEDFIKRIAAQGDPEFTEHMRQWQTARNQLEAAQDGLDAVFGQTALSGTDFSATSPSSTRTTD